MRKRFLFSFSVFLLFSCTSPVTDLPKTDNAQFIVSESEFLFPSGTSALEMYNCLHDALGDGEKECSGVYKKVETATLNGKEHKEELTRNIVKLKIGKVERLLDNHTVNTHSFFVDFFCSDSSVLKFCYEWQYESTNTWRNDMLKNSQKEKESIQLFAR